MVDGAVNAGSGSSKKIIGLITDALLLNSGTLQPLRQILGGLTSLALHVQTLAPQWTDAGELEVPQMNLPAAFPFLSVVSNLQILKVVLVNVHPWFRESITRTAFNCLFGECTLPQLRSLSLSRVAVSDSQLIQLLLRSPQLESLVLDDVCLLSGDWQGFPRKVRDILPRMRFQNSRSNGDGFYGMVFSIALSNIHKIENGAMIRG